ncbi:probable G-protein coupled receptor 148 [Hyperolius riggenbachi]|uniref:probable G-protein coupled receptor 148 n=1 Tax=Hyperolius riggenbachi TaxID=752182 RepID=UPI0035A3D16E
MTSLEQSPALSRTQAVREVVNASLCHLPGLFNASLILQREMNSNTTALQPMDIKRPTQFMIQEWIFNPSYTEMNMFIIPTVFCCTTALLITPSVIFSIYSNFSMRQETRFLLLGNTIICDLIYLMFYTVTAICNMMNVQIPKNICIIFLFVLAVAYGGGVLTTAFMVVDTYLAILWPLRYASLLPARRTKKLLLLLWLSSLIVPAVIFLATYFTQNSPLCPLQLCSLPVILLMALHGDETLKFFYILVVIIFLLCFSLILCCYIILYFKTKDTGIWKSISSRANVTFFMKHTMLLFYMSPLLLLLSESLLYMGKVIGLRTALWITLTICNVLIVLPKAASPFLYGLRYREIYKSFKLLFGLKKHRGVAPIKQEI